MAKKIDKPNSLFLYISAHGSDGIIFSSKDPARKDQSMLKNMSSFIATKLHVDDSSLKDIPPEAITNSVCQLFLGEAVSVSGVCALYSPWYDNNPLPSETELNIVGTYNIFNTPSHGVNNLNLSNHGKFIELLDRFKQLYIRRNLSKVDRLTTEEMKTTHAQNTTLSKTDGLFRSFTPSPFERDKQFYFSPAQEEITDGTSNTEHYGIHFVSVTHKYLPEKFGSIDPFPLDVRGVQPKPSRSLTNFEADPYNMNHLNNQTIFRHILNERISAREITHEEFTEASAILDSLIIVIGKKYPSTDLSKLWILFTILGFDEVYILDTSCRELIQMEQSESFRSGMPRGEFNKQTTVNAGTHADSISWTADINDPGENLVTRGKAKQNLENLKNAKLRKGGRKTRKTRKCRKPRKCKRSKRKRNKLS